MDLLSIMKRVELFRGLSDQQLTQIGDLSTRQTYPDGAMIISQGSQGDAIYIISSGQVAVQARNPRGENVDAVYLGEGQIVGEMALIDQAPRSASVAAVGEETVVYSIPIQEFTTLCQANTDIGYIMMRNMAQDLSFKLRHQGLKPINN
jgi:CRP/FNR family transcriptional regulator, cyclic AMP receptor protein